ncbi:MAG TPA: hypothetical protein VIJ45_05380 [Coriobacteriia bacterium]
MPVRFESESAPKPRRDGATISITLDTLPRAIPAMQEEAATLITELVFAGE